ncbi:MAG: pilus assembly protein CpaF [Acidimicrobiales bacterium]|nr:pilus assembly protein CpaF [Acidimicrobiales bacterium]
MKLSEKLAALEEAERLETEATPVTQMPGQTPRKSTTGPTTVSGKAKKAVNENWEASKRKVRELVLTEVAPKMGNLSGDALIAEVKSALDGILQREDVKVSPLERRKFVEEVIQDTLGYGPLDPLLADPSITEVMCNSYDDIWVEREGRIEHVDVAFTDDNQYRAVIDKIVSAIGRRIDEGSPMVDARLPDGSRVNVIIPPLAVHGTVMTIRKFAADPYTVKDLINFGTFTLDLAVVMEACVRGKLNILVSGGTGTGKTTNLNVLSSFIPDGERILTIEDAAELQLQQPHVITLEARPANAEGAGEVRIRDLVKNALRMRPDRIIVGEVRGAEALDMLQAMNTGHEGSMTTVHSNGPRDALSRLETMVLMAGFELPVKAIREQINAAINVIMHLDRQPDGRRVVTSVSELQGMEGETILLQEIFKFRPSIDASGRSVGELVATGLRPKFLDKLAEANIDVPAKAFQAPRLSSAAPTATPRTSRAMRVPNTKELATPERSR